MRLRSRLVVLGTVGLLGCSGSPGGIVDAAGPDAASPDGRTDPPDAAAVDAAGADAISLDAAAADAASLDAASLDAPTDAPACVSGGACSTNPGAPCLTGVIACAGDVATCVDGAAASDGTACAAGLCTLGACLPPTPITTSVDLSTAPLTAGRTCAEAPSFGLTAIAGAALTVDPAPVDDCLVVGDEVLVINLQGTPTATANLGAWELARIGAVSGGTITLAAPLVRHYGATLGADDGIGPGAGDQKVAVVRVPRFGELTVAAGATLSAAAWTGTRGSVLALRAASLTVDGTITMRGRGYRSGRWSRDGGCDTNVITEAGESYTGPAVAAVATNGGAAGGISAVAGVSFNNNTPLSSTAGHASAGLMGGNGLGRTLGPPGGSYGGGDGATLTMGSGTSGNLTCIGGGGAPVLIAAPAPTAGGVIVLLVDQLTVGASGQITASALGSPRDVAASGGTVLLRGRTLDLGADRVSAAGAIAIAGTGLGPFVGATLAASPGYVIVDATTVTGTTTPPASTP